MVRKMAEIKFSTNKSGKDLNIDGKKAGRWGLILVIVILFLILLFNCFAIVQEGFIGVKYQFGRIVNDDMKPGLNFKIPFIEEIRQVEVRQLVFPFEGDAYTKDTQRVGELRVKLTYRYTQDKLSYLVQVVGIENIEARILFPKVQSTTKDEIGKINAEMLVQSRDSVQTAIQAKLYEVLLPEGIEVTAFAIENIAFEPVFLDSVQAKVVAEQDALRMKNVTSMREEEANQVRIAAQAEADRVLIEAESQAEAIRLIQEQIAQNPEYIEYLKIIQWDGILPQVIGDGVNPFVVLGSTDRPASNYTPATQD